MWNRRFEVCLAVFSITFALFQSNAQPAQVIYTDSLQNGWQDWSWATVNKANGAPVHNGSYSISVTCNNSSSDWQALYLSIPQTDPAAFTNLVFWVNGGSGGQQVQVQAIVGGAAQPPIHIGPLSTNSWKQIIVPFTALGAANKPNFAGFWLQGEGGAPLPTFYVDDVALQLNPPPAPSTNNPVTVQVDAAADRHPISPLIYGMAFASSNQLKDLNVPLNRSGGNAETRYNWLTNASNHAFDWYFESLEEPGTAPGAAADQFIADSKNGGAQPMITMPIIGWVAKLGPNRQRLSSFSIAKYGPQTGNDWQWFPDAGNGTSSATGQPITTNDPTDANLIADTNFQAGWVQHLTNRWGTAASGGLRYYIMDNEWGLWHSTHRDVHPVGATMDETLNKFCDYATMVKALDPNALVIGPEEWGWSGYLYSGYDQQWGSEHGWGGTLPDRAAHGNQDYMPWLLNQIRLRSEAAGKRLLDVFTLHFYPQGGEALSDDVSTATQLRRNRSTRALWDTNYVDETWINDKVMLIPRMKMWVATNYPGTLVGITEYNWGAETDMNGATAQADVFGIFGREGLDLATRWTTPNSGTPAYNSIKMYRNYDGNKSTFGDTSVRATVPNPDQLSAFAAIRSSDGMLTVMAINKDPVNATPLVLQLTNAPAAGTARVWQLASNVIAHLPDTGFTNGVLNKMLPARSITLFILPAIAPFDLRTEGQVSGQLEVWLDGQAGRTYVLQSSTDLLNWSPVATNMIPSNSFPFALSASNTRTFYRGVLVQP